MKEPARILGVRYILALDLGTKTGWAFGDSSPEHPQSMGTEVLARAREIRDQAKRGDDRNCDCRFSRLRALLNKWCPQYGTLVVFEDVQFATTSMQAHLWATFRAAVWELSSSGAVIRAVPVGTLKKFATGKGNATKEMMAAHLRARDGDHWPGEKLDDNAVDAVWLWYYAKRFLV